MVIVALAAGAAVSAGALVASRWGSLVYHDRHFVFQAGGGHVSILFFREGANPLGNPPERLFWFGPILLDGVWRPVLVRKDGNTQFASIPLWMMVTLFAVYPVIAVVCSCGPLRRWRRRRAGHCITCDYDLSGNVSGVCPECGSRCAWRAGAAKTVRDVDARAGSLK